MPWQSPHRSGRPVCLPQLSADKKRPPNCGQKADHRRCCGAFLSVCCHDPPVAITPHRCLPHARSVISSLRACTIRHEDAVWRRKLLGLWQLPIPAVVCEGADQGRPPQKSTAYGIADEDLYAQCRNEAEDEHGSIQWPKVRQTHQDDCLPNGLLNVCHHCRPSRAGR